MSNVVATAVVYNPDGSVFNRIETEFNFMSPEMEKVFNDGLVKQQEYLSDMKANQKKSPDDIYSATLTATGQPELKFEAFTYDMYQKAMQAWHKTLESVIKEGEKFLKKGS